MALPTDAKIIAFTKALNSLCAQHAMRPALRQTGRAWELVVHPLPIDDKRGYGCMRNSDTIWLDWLANRPVVEARVVVVKQV